MLIFPAVDIKDGCAVRLVKGDYSTASQVADSPLNAAAAFKAAGAEWLHVVDLDGAKDKRPVNRDVILEIVRTTGLKVEVGGGIRDMATVDDYINNGVERIILGSAALNDKEFLREALAAHGEHIAVGIDARNGMVAANGWLETSKIGYIELAKEMEQMGVKTIIFTDISRDGTLTGPNFEQLEALNNAVSCNITASGGVRDANCIETLHSMNVYGVICGKALYQGTLELTDALEIAKRPRELDCYFEKSELIPCVVQSCADDAVLMLAYMNKESLALTLETGTTWFWSRSRQELWNKGATSGNIQRVKELFYDCDRDTLLVKVEEAGPACHTGNRTCFYRRLK